MSSPFEGSLQPSILERTQKTKIPDRVYIKSRIGDRIGDRTGDMFGASTGDMIGARTEDRIGNRIRDKID